MKLLWALALVGTCTPVAAKETLQCPDTLRVSDAVLQSPDLPAGTSIDLERNGSLRLFSMGVYSGHPRDMAQLIPSNEGEPKPRGRSISIWRFEGPYPYGKYLVCAYGPVGSVQVYKRVGDPVTACTGERRGKTRRTRPSSARRSSASESWRCPV
ncbi:hypothetical protein GUF76_17285 [Xanthomonas citri pv. citri]|nr:hypothetical protein [Xanthomonas citri pv. citri]